MEMRSIFCQKGASVNIRIWSFRQKSGCTGCVQAKSGICLKDKSTAIECFKGKDKEQMPAGINEGYLKKSSALCNQFADSPGR